MKRIRTFIAITLPPEFARKVGKLQEELEKKNLPIRWEYAEKLHLTILFLGHITQARMEAAAKATEAAAAKFEPFEAQANGISYLYKRGADSVVYLDIRDPDRALRNLYKELFRGLVEESFYPPTRFTPHISLGRLKKQRYEHDRKRILQQAINIDFKPLGGFNIDNLDVYESIYQSGNNQQRYHLLKSFPLGKMG